MADSVVVRTLFCACGVTTVGGSVAAGCVMLNTGHGREATSKVEEKRIVIPPLSAEAKKNADDVSLLLSKHGKGKLLVENSSDSGWKFAGNRYRQIDVESNEHGFNIEDFKNKKEQEEVPVEFGKACSDSLTSSKFNRGHPLFLSVFTWCVTE